jgi:hypothetical protein
LVLDGASWSAMKGVFLIWRLSIDHERLLIKEPLPLKWNVWFGLQLHIYYTASCSLCGSYLSTGSSCSWGGCRFSVPQFVKSFSCAKAGKPEHETGNIWRRCIKIASGLLHLTRLHPCGACSFDGSVFEHKLFFARFWFSFVHRSSRHRSLLVILFLGRVLFHITFFYWDCELCWAAHVLQRIDPKRLMLLRGPS